MGTNLQAMKLTFKIEANLCNSFIHTTVSYRDGYLNFSAWFMKNVLFQQKKLNYGTNGILWKIKQRICSMSFECSTFPCCLNIQDQFLRAFPMCVCTCKLRPLKGQLV